MSITKHQEQLSKIRALHTNLKFNPQAKEVLAWKEDISSIDPKKIVAILAFAIGVEHLLDLVRLTRNTLGCNLKEAKDLVDDYVNYYSI